MDRCCRGLDQAATLRCARGSSTAEPIRLGENLAGTGWFPGCETDAAGLLAQQSLGAKKELVPFLSMISSYTSGWKRAFDYAGRSTRSDFWWFQLLNTLIYIILSVITAVLAGAFPDNLLPAGVFGSLSVLFYLGWIVAAISLSVRRMRDIGKEWYWIFISLVPCIGGFWFLYLTIQPSVLG